MKPPRWATHGFKPCAMCRRHALSLWMSRAMFLKDAIQPKPDMDIKDYPDIDALRKEANELRTVQNRNDYLYACGDIICTLFRVKDKSWNFIREWFQQHGIDAPLHILKKSLRRYEEENGLVEDEEDEED